jgi:F0F1-type ATP synthase assembly protein I
MQGDQRGTGHRKTGFGTGQSGLASVGTLAGAGIEFAVLVVVFLYIGKWLDGRFHTSPVLMIVGAFLGAAGGVYSLYRMLVAQQGGSVKRGDGPPGR